jgi:hypothetical protein
MSRLWNPISQHCCLLVAQMPLYDEESDKASTKALDDDMDSLAECAELPEVPPTLRWEAALKGACHAVEVAEASWVSHADRPF